MKELLEKEGCWRAAGMLQFRSPLPRAYSRICELFDLGSPFTIPSFQRSPKRLGYVVAYLSPLGRAAGLHLSDCIADRLRKTLNCLF